MIQYFKGSMHLKQLLVFRDPWFYVSELKVTGILFLGAQTFLKMNMTNSTVQCPISLLQPAHLHLIHESKICLLSVCPAPPLSLEQSWSRLFGV